MSAHCTLGYAPFPPDAAILLEATLVIVPRDLLITDTRSASVSRLPSLNDFASNLVLV